MAITIKDITELPTGTPVGTSPIIYGDGTNLFTTTLNYILSQVSTGITDLSYFVNDTITKVFVIGGDETLNFNITITAGQLYFVKLNVIENEVFTTNTYLVPLGAGTYNPLQTTLGLSDLILVEKHPIVIPPKGSNTVTYTATDLADVNASNPALDLTDSNTLYYIELDSGEYRFIGLNGIYGVGGLTMVESDLEGLTQAVSNPQPATGTPPASGTFAVALNNFFGTDYSGTITSLTSLTIASGAVLGGFARIKGNWSVEPTITGATQADNSDFQASTNLYLYIEKWNDGIIYWYDLY